MTDVIGKGVIEVSADATKLKAGMEDAKRSIKSLGETTKTATKSASDSIDRYITRLDTQAATSGKSARETELYKLALRGASKAQLEAADSALKMAEGYEKGVAIGTKARAVFFTIATAAAAGLVAAYAGFDSLVKKAGDFQDMAEKTGDTAENMASLAVAAGTAGASMDTVVSASEKLTKGLTGVDDDSKAAGAAIKALGLNLADFKKQSPAAQLEQVGQALNSFQDGAEKTAVAMALFGKSGAELLPFLKELGAEGGRQVILSQEQIALADEYADKQARLRTELGLHAQAIALKLLPALNDFKQTISDVAKDQILAAQGSEVLKGALVGTIDVFKSVVVFGASVGAAFKVIGLEIGGAVAQAERLAHLDFKGAGLIGRSINEDVQKAFDNVERLQKKLFADAPAAKFSDPRLTGPVASIAEQTKDFGKAKLAFTGTAKTDGKAADHFADNFINQLITEYANLSGAMSKVDEVTRKLDTNTNKFTATEHEQALTLAKQIDAHKYKTAALVGEQAALQALADIMDQAESAYASNLTALRAGATAQAFEASLIGKTADEVARLRFERELSLKISEAEAQVLDQQNAGLIDAVEAYRRLVAVKRFGDETRTGFDAIASDKRDQQTNPLRGVAEASKDYLAEIANIGDAMKNVTTNAFKGMEDALVSFTTTGKLDFKTLANSIIGDLVRIQIQQSITKPLAGLISGNASGIGKLFGFADGGVMSSAGPMPLRAYAGGGIANSPQVALYGEGSMAEAFVPLPDGRSIPVSLSGNGGGSSIVINQPITLNAQNASAETVGQIRALMPAFIAENARTVTAVVQQAMRANGGGLRV